MRSRRDSFIGSPFFSPSSASADLLKHQLELVEKARIERDVLRPHVRLRVVGHEISELEMCADLEIGVFRPDLNEALGMVVPRESLGEIDADAIPVQHAAHL